MFSALKWKQKIRTGNPYLLRLLLKGGTHSFAHVSVMSQAYCFVTNQWRVDFHGKFAFMNRGYAVGQLCSMLLTCSLFIVRFHSFEKEMSSEDTGRKVASVTACVPERMEVKCKAVLAKRMVYSAREMQMPCDWQKSPESGRIFTLLFTYILFQLLLLYSKLFNSNDHSNVF